MGLQAMFSGVSGLKSNSTWLDVIGNNISNMSTVGYKASRVEFADQISQTLYGGQGDNQGSNYGGVDPRQVGLGTRVASIQAIFTEGTLQNTGLSTDVAIVGNGFLISKSGNQINYTRAGNLEFDSNGNLVDANGGLIQGFTATVQYSTRPLMATTAPPTQLVAGVNTPGDANITQAYLKLDNTNMAAVSNIQIKPDMTQPANATTIMNFAGNLDSFQQADQPGGIEIIANNTAAGLVPVLPIGIPAVLFPGANNAWDTAAGGKLSKLALANGDIVLQQENNLCLPIDAGNPTPNQTTMDMTGAVDLGGVAAADTGTNYAWENPTTMPPAHTIAETVYDSEGNQRQVTIQFYQVNDLGTYMVNGADPINPSPGPNQVAYAWYAFDTTNGAPVSTNTLIGGSGIIEGDSGALPANAPVAPAIGYDRGLAGASFWGDLLYFNTDGSLASMGAIGGLGAAPYNGEYLAHLYLSPLNTQPATSPLPEIGAEVTDITLNFGSPGVLGAGKRDGLYSDAMGSYQVINGINTYVPNHTAYAKSQDGFASGILQSLAFDNTGTIQGTFSNGQTAAIGQLVLAQPSNPDGLINSGNNYYQDSVNAGPIFNGLAGQLNLGTIQGGSLEGSNVDLTTELSNMIIAQRGFDVNARIVSVTNETLQTLTQLGQGG